MLLAGLAGANTVRVTTWDLGFKPQTASLETTVLKVADELKALDPDVILLQRVQDWHMCDLLVAALQPRDYKVLICSTFAESPLLPPRPQVAILCKRTAYFTWSGNWAPLNRQNHSEEGVAFAAIEASGQRLGFFTALFDEETSGLDAGRRLLEQVGSIRRWETNQVQTFVIGASFNGVSRTTTRALSKAARALEQGGLIDASEKLPSDARSTGSTPDGPKDAVADGLFAGPLGFPGQTTITPSSRWEHYPITCDLELDPDKVAAALELRAADRREREAQTGLAIRTGEYAAAAALVAGSITALIIWRRRKKNALERVAALNRLAVRGAPDKTASPLRPVVLVQAPGNKQTAGPPPLPKAVGPVLRIKRSSRFPVETASPATPAQQPPLVPEPHRIHQPQEPAGLEHNIELLGPVPPTTAEIKDPALRHGLIRELSTWLKQKFVRKLVTDRAQLIQAQQMAARMANTLDDRLARIEAQIQQQNQAYVRRIEELNKELAAAREENRELIRERIAQVKAEMEAARARALAEANLDNSSFRL